MRERAPEPDRKASDRASPKRYGRAIGLALAAGLTAWLLGVT